MVVAGAAAGFALTGGHLVAVLVEVALAVMAQPATVGLILVAVAVAVDTVMAMDRWAALVDQALL
jgi:hypothetical protein